MTGSPTLNESNAPMDDLTATRLCAEAMGYTIWSFRESSPDRSAMLIVNELRAAYDPLNDDAQAMALVKRFNPEISRSKGGSWLVRDYRSGTFLEDADLNRAIVMWIAVIREGSD